MHALGMALAALIGLSLGLLGGGGSILTVPILVYVLGYPPKPAIAMSLAVVGTTSLLGAATHWRQGNVNLRVALVFGIVAMGGSYAGARVARYVSGTTQLVTFAIVMLAAAIFMFRSARRPPGEERPHGQGVPLPLLLVIGVAVGMLTGLVGVGGGFLIVPALVILGGLPAKEAIGTSLLVIAMNAFTGFAGYIGTVPMAWGFMAAFTAVALLGVFAGTHLSRFVSARALKQTFAVFLVVVGAFILYRNR